METIKDIVCRNCKRLLDKSVNLTEVARLMQIHPSTISRWKSGEHAPELDKIDRLAAILKVDRSEFFKSSGLSQSRAPVSKLLNILSSIPDEVYEKATRLDINHKAWRDVISVLEGAIEDMEEMREAAKKA